MTAPQPLNKFKQYFDKRNDGKKVGSAMCIVHVLDNGNLALTFFNDEELEKFHNDYIHLNNLEGFNLNIIDKGD